LRTDASRASQDAAESERDAKIEQLLLVGLDHYFAAQYEQAINVWTRALFLDRSHARARAYIERARSALAERQRQSEELLQNGLAAFGRGDSDEARRLLEAAMRHGAPSDEALSVLERLNRLLQGAGSPAPSAPRAGVVVPSPGVQASAAAPHSRSFRRIAPWVLGGAVAALLLLAVSAGWPGMLMRQPTASAPPGVAAPAEPPLPMLTRGEMAMGRARTLAAAGHLRDALLALDAVRPTDDQRPDADRLRADLQRQLMAFVETPAPPRSIAGAGLLPEP
jgi:hypothetical protein